MNHQLSLFDYFDLLNAAENMQHNNFLFPLRQCMLRFNVQGDVFNASSEESFRKADGKQTSSYKMTIKEFLPSSSSFLTQWSIFCEEAWEKTDFETCYLFPSENPWGKINNIILGLKTRAHIHRRKQNDNRR